MSKYFVPGDRFIPHRVFSAFSVIPNCLMRYHGLSPGEKLAWGRLAQYAGQDGKVYPALATLGQELAVSGRQASSYVRGLVEKGFLKRQPQSGRSTSYIFLWHEVFELEGKQDTSCPVEEFFTPLKKTTAQEKTNELLEEETTQLEICRRRGISLELSEDVKRYIELKIDYENSRGSIRSTKAAYKAGLVNLALRGRLDTSGLEELEGWKKRGWISSSNKNIAAPEILDRVKDYQKADGRNPSEIIELIQKQMEDGGVGRFWGLPIAEVASSMRVLFPEHW